MKRVLIVLGIAVAVVYAVIIILLIPAAMLIGPIVEALFIKRDLSIFADALTFVLVFSAGSLLVGLLIYLVDRLLKPETKKVLKEGILEVLGFILGFVYVGTALLLLVAFLDVGGELSSLSLKQIFGNSVWSLLFIISLFFIPIRIWQKGKEEE